MWFADTIRKTDIEFNQFALSDLPTLYPQLMAAAYKGNTKTVSISIRTEADGLIAISFLIGVMVILELMILSLLTVRAWKWIFWANNKIRNIEVYAQQWVLSIE